MPKPADEGVASGNTQLMARTSYTPPGLTPPGRATGDQPMTVAASSATTVCSM